MTRLTFIFSLILLTVTGLLVTSGLILGRIITETPQVAFVAIVDERLNSVVYTYDVERDLRATISVQTQSNRALRIGTDPYWIDDGEQLLLGVLGGEINRIAVPGGQMTPVTNILTTPRSGITDIAVSPDGRWLAYTLLAAEHGDVYLVSLEGEQTQDAIQITETIPQFTYEHLRWLHDSSGLLFTTRRINAGTRPALYHYDVNTENMRLVAFDLRFVWDVAVAPNGSRLIYLSSEDNMAALFALDLQAEAPEPELLLAEENLEMNEIASSPDGTQWALTGFEYNRNANAINPVLYLMDTASGEINSRKFMSGRPVWSLDGRYLALTDFAPDRSGEVRVRILDADGNLNRQITLTNGELISRANWRP